MPCKNVIKEYVAQGFYHLYNRGVEKRLIFLDEQDYGVFLNYLKTYLSPKDSDQLHRQLEFPGLTSKEREDLLQQIRLKNFASEIKLIAYTLMPNHFHFLVQQEAADSITGFMNSLGNRYTMYFNSRHKRVGCLFQGTYKGVFVTSEEQFLQLSHYVHKQTVRKGATLPDGRVGGRVAPFPVVQPSSLPDYLRQRQTNWLHPEDVLGYFSRTNPRFSYAEFMGFQPDLKDIKDLVIEEDEG